MNISRHTFVSATATGLVLVLLQSSCAAVSDEVNTTISETKASKPASLADSQAIVADFRIAESHAPAVATDTAPTKADTSSNTVASTANAKKIVDTAMGAGAYERYRLADSAQGYFTDSEQRQSLHLIVDRKVTAIAKKVIPSILVIFQDNRPITQFVPDKAAYLDIASVVDIDKDGLNEVVLTATAYQMGSQFVAADVYGFNNSNDILKQEIGVVYVNTCDSAAADDRQVRASVLFTTANTDKLTTESFVAPCDKNGEAPNAELFMVEPVQ